MKPLSRLVMDVKSCRQCFGIILLLSVTFCVSFLYLNANPKIASRCSGCDVYNLSGTVSHEYDCVKTSYQPPVALCIYPVEEDIRISYSLKVYGSWELAGVQMIQKWLADRADAGLIDIGANLGVFSLLALAMGHRTLAVEPNVRSVQRLGASVRTNKLDIGRLIVLRNAVGDRRAIVNLIRSKDNQGDTRTSDSRTGWTSGEQVNMIVMDDLAEFCTFSEAIMKIDIQGYEHKAFVQAGRLFDAVKIDYVMMEMRELVAMTRTQHPKSRDILLIEDMLGFLTGRGYRPRDLSGSDISPINWRQWPDDVIWIK